MRRPGCDSGGPLVDVHGALPPGGGAVLLLVHGYANSASAARDSWGAFLEGIAAVKIGGWMPRNPTGLQWPGDEPIAGLNQASYPLKIDVSRDAARRMDAYLRAMAGPGSAPLMLSVVAHSLGCRLVAELLECLAQPPAHSVVVDRVVLMAAAVPTDRVDRGEELRAGVDWAGGICALYSEGDPVLRLAFPIGETVGGDGFFPTAVGRHGGPGATWMVTRQMAHDGSLYGHSDYWAGPESAAAAAAFFWIPVAASVAARGTLAHGLPEVTAIPSRATPSRAIAARSLAAVG
ncbi:MAG: alpha/beta hydrolase family protein [Gemmatimonadaceae bacterium]